MSSKQVIKASKIREIKVDDILLGTKKIGKSVPISLNNKSIVFQTPFLEVKGELRKTQLPNIYQLDTLFRGDAAKKINQFFQFIEAVESHVSEQVNDNGTKWFTQKNIIFKSLVREVENEKGIFFIKWLINMQPDMFVDENKKSFDCVNLHNKDFVKLIVEISNLCLDEKQCGLAAFVQKVQVKEHIEKLESEYIFNSDSENESDEKTHNIMSLFGTEQKKPEKTTTTIPKNLSPQNKKKVSRIDPIAVTMKNERKTIETLTNKNDNAKSNQLRQVDNSKKQQEALPPVIRNQNMWQPYVKQPHLDKSGSVLTGVMNSNKQEKLPTISKQNIEPELSDNSYNSDDVVSDKDQNNRLNQLLDETSSENEMVELDEDDLEM